MPLAAPVITATFPSSLRMMFSFQILAIARLPQRYFDPLASVSMLPHCAAIRHRARLRRTVSSRCIITSKMSRVPNNRRAAGAMIRSVEGMHQRDATRASPDAEPEASEHVLLAAQPDENPDRDQATSAVPDARPEASESDRATHALP